MFELERTGSGELYVRMKQGKKGNSESREDIAMRVGFDEMAGLWFRLHKIMQGQMDRATVYHDRGNGNYKVFEVTADREKGTFISLSEGKKGDREGRKHMAIRVSSDELSGLWYSLMNMLMQ